MTKPKPTRLAHVAYAAYRAGRAKENEPTHAWGELLTGERRVWELVALVVRADLLVHPPAGLSAELEATLARLAKESGAVEVLRGVGSK